MDPDRLRRRGTASGSAGTNHRGASYGDALLAARAVGLAGQDEDWSRIAGTVEPNPKNKGLYDQLYGVYRGLYPATRELMHTLADLQK